MIIVHQANSRWVNVLITGTMVFIHGSYSFVNVFVNIIVRRSNYMTDNLPKARNTIDFNLVVIMCFISTLAI